MIYLLLLKKTFFSHNGCKSYTAYPRRIFPRAVPQMPRHPSELCGSDLSQSQGTSTSLDGQPGDIVVYCLLYSRYSSLFTPCIPYLWNNTCMNFISRIIPDFPSPISPCLWPPPPWQTQSVYTLGWNPPERGRSSDCSGELEATTEQIITIQNVWK